MAHDHVHELLAAYGRSLASDDFRHVIERARSRVADMAQTAEVRTDRRRPVVRCFVSYSRNDAILAERFVDLLQQRFETLHSGKMVLWIGSGLSAREAWNTEAIEATDRSALELPLVSPHSVASEYLTALEAPLYRPQTDRQVMPVGLCPVVDSGRFKDVQMYLLQGPGGRHQWFSECSGVDTYRFVDGLVEELAARVALDHHR